MKKFVICLLLICTICLGCFALTACDKNGQPSDGIPRNTFWKVENSPLDSDCYAFYYTGEYKSFYIQYYYRHYGNEHSTKYSYYSLYVETLTSPTPPYTSSNNHQHIIKPESIAYIPLYVKSDYVGGAFIYHPTKLEYVAYDSYTDGSYTNERIIFTTTFEYTDFIYIERDVR